MLLVGSLSITIQVYGMDAQERQHWENVLEAVRVTPYQTVRKTDRSAFLALDEIRERDRAWRDRLKMLDGLYINYTYHHKRIRVSARALRLQEKSRLGAAEVWRQMRYAKDLDSERIFYAMFNLRKKSPKSQSFYREATKVKVFSGDETFVLRPSDRMGEVHPGKARGMEKLGQEYFRFVDLQQQAPSMHIQNILQHPELYRVKPYLEEVDGALCHVISCGEDVRWLDHKHGCCLRRCVRFVKDIETQEKRLAYIVACKDVAQLSDDIWWPRSCVIVQYTPDGTPVSEPGKISSVTEVSVMELHDHPDPSLFDFRFPAGTLVSDRSVGKAYFMPEGIENLDNAIRRGKKLIDGRVTELPVKYLPAEINGRRWRTMLGIVTVGMLGASLFAYYWWRVAQRQRIK